MVTCHLIKPPGRLSWMQPFYVSTYPSELFTCSLHFKPRYTLLMGTPIHSQKQPASNPKPEITVFSATVKSVNLLIKCYTGLSKVNSTPSPGGSSFVLVAVQERNWAPPARWDRRFPGRVRVSSCPAAPVQALAAVCHTRQGALRDRVSHSSAQGMDVSNAFWTALLQTGRGATPPANVIRIHAVSFPAISGCHGMSLGAGGSSEEYHFACLLPAQHFPFPRNFSFLANSFIGGFKHFHTQHQRKHQLIEGSSQFDLRPAHSSPGTHP